MPQIEAKKSSDITEFLSKNGGVVVVDCYATWCGPCKFVAPLVHAMSQSTGVGLVKIDVDQCQELSQAYGIKCMPTFLLIQGQWNNVVEKIQGADQESLQVLFSTAVAMKL